MPNNKKKKGGGGKCKKSAERAAMLARRADRSRRLEDMPPFPGPETPDRTMERLLGCEHLSMDDEPVSIKRGEDGGKIFLQKFTRNMEKEGGRREVSAPDLVGLSAVLIPDYDRNAADYPVARQVMEKVPRPDDVARKVKKCIGDVPEENLDVFMKFMERGENIKVVCFDCSPDNAPKGFEGLTNFIYHVRPLGGGFEDELFQLIASAEGRAHFMGFSGCLSTKCLQKYQRELGMLLSYECMTRLSAGTAEIVGELNSDVLLGPLCDALKALYRERKRWSDLAFIESFRLERAIRNKSSLTTTTFIGSNLGEALEACGFYSQAAMVYAEAAKYLCDAKHFNTSSVLCNTGLAWKRHGDFAVAESYYAASLNSLCFQDNHVDYRSSIFCTITNLWQLYYDSVKKVHVTYEAWTNCGTASFKLVVTLRALIIAAGQPSPGMDSFRDNGVPSLRSALQNASADEACRAIQFIAEKATSVESMKEAILSFANPGASHIEVWKTGEPDLERGKDGAREYLRGQAASNDFLASCTGCGEVKMMKLLGTCPCKNAYYCDSSCQKAHWPQHSAECKAARKAKKR